MRRQKLCLLGLSLILVMLFAMIPVQAADIVIDDDGPLYTTVLNGGEGSYKGENTLRISYGHQGLYPEDYLFTREGYTLLGWSESKDADTLDYTRFSTIYTDEGESLYAVWGEGESCALYNGMKAAAGEMLGRYRVAADKTLPGGEAENFVGWYDHRKGFHEAGSAVTPGEIYTPIYANAKYPPVLLAGNGGTSNFGAEYFYAGQANSWFSATIYGHEDGLLPFSRDGYLVSGWEDQDGTLIAAADKFVGSCPAADTRGVVTLYARWSKADQLKNGAKLIIDGKDQTGLLGQTHTVRGDGWSLFLSHQLILNNGYAGGGIARDRRLTVSVDGTVTTGQIEVNGELRVDRYSDASKLYLRTSGISAIRAETVQLVVGAAIEAKDAVGVDASRLYLDCSGITITGKPAVREDTQIVCSDGIGYTLSEDRTTLTTYAPQNSVTLNGNGGTYDGKEAVTAAYSMDDPLGLQDYTFTREGCVLVEWKSKDGSWFTPRNDRLFYTPYDTLYAVWLKVPENYAVFGGTDSLSGAYDSYRDYYSVDLSGDFVMPSTAKQETVIWRDCSTGDLYYSGERTAPQSGSWFDVKKIFKAAADMHVILLDGNGGRYAYNGQKTNRVLAGYAAEGETVDYAARFTRPGYTLVSYNSKPDGSGTEYALNKCVGTADMAPVQLLYAQWEKDRQADVMLYDYGQLGDVVFFGGSRDYTYHNRLIDTVETDTQYTLPDSLKSGYRFLGWRSGEDGKLYPAGTTITVTHTVQYFAEYELLYLTIGGKRYPMDRDWDCREQGWMYCANGIYSPCFGHNALNLYEGYSGAAIEATGALSVWLFADMELTAPDGKPLLAVDGDLRLCVESDLQDGVRTYHTTKLTGGSGAPAVKATGTLYLSSPVTLTGGDGAAAIQAEKLEAGYAFLAGESEAQLTCTGSYQSEHCLRMDSAAPVLFQPGQTLPRLPDTQTHRFIGWSAVERGFFAGAGACYLPGERVEGSEKYLYACYASESEAAFILDGNGGATGDGQTQYLAITLGSGLRLTKNALEFLDDEEKQPTLTEQTAASVFSRDGYTLTGYNTSRDGTGTSYTAQELAAQARRSKAIAGTEQTFYAQWSRTDDAPVTPVLPVDPPQPAQPSKPTQTTTPDGSTDYTVSGSTAKIDAVDVDKLVTDSGEKKTAEIDLSDAKSSITDVTLPTDAVKKVADSDAESLTVKLPDVTVSFDDKALAAVAGQSGGEALELSVSVGSADNRNLTDAQKHAITGARELSVIEVSLGSGDKAISDFNGGSVTIHVPFQWSMKGLLRAYYIDENGNRSAIDVTYKNGVASLVLKHFSTYVLEVVDALPFADVSANDYYFDAVSWAVKNAIAAGQSSTAFAPGASCTRAQMVTFLWRAAGSPVVNYAMDMADVSEDAYYAEAVRWALSEGITAGTSAAMFGPDDVCTRAQAVTFLFRYAAPEAVTLQELVSGFSDANSVPGYALPAMNWALAAGILQGDGKNLMPNDACTRAQIVTFLYRADRSK